jgi:membrane associated rhomboid family serine protease
MVYKRYQQPEARAVLALIAINIVFFIATLVNENLVYTLGLEPNIWLKHPWTLLTSMFVHGGTNYLLYNLMHIAANMWMLYFLGSYLCSMIGDARFLTIYFVGGIVGNFFYIVLSLYTPLGDPFIPVIGASGAIFAVAGAFMMLAPKMKVMVFPIPVPMPLWVAIMGSFLLISFFPGVAWQAHLGGLLTGVVAGYILKKRRKYILL